MLTAILSCFVLAGAAPFIQRLAGNAAGWLLALLPAALFIFFLAFTGEVAAGGVLDEAWRWLPALGIDLSFRLDGLGLVFALLITGIGALIVCYSGVYLAGHPRRGQFLSVLLMFMGSMLGLVLADNIIAFFVFWELTSITSFLLIGFDHTREASRRAAIQALIVTGGGGLVLMAGLIGMGVVTGDWTLSALNTNGDFLRSHPLYEILLVLVIVGAFTKSAQIPFHFWLPNAMEAPTPVSAYLHSATMVKAGVYLLMRLTPALGGTELWTAALTTFGALTLLVGAILSIRQTDLKLILAYTTVASLGLLVLMLGIGSELAVQAAVLYLIAHAFFKGALFMVAGIIDHATGTREITALGGLRRVMPLTFAAAALAALSMAGLPPLAGFLAKEAAYGAAGSGLLALAAIIGNALMIAAALAVAWSPFRGERTPTPLAPHEAPFGLLLGPAVLSISGILVGLLAGLFGTTFAGPMVGAILGRPISLDLALWHGLNLPLLLSLITIALGVAAYAVLPRLRSAIALALARIGTTADSVYDFALAGLVSTCGVVVRILQPGQLRLYMLATFLILALAILIPIGIFGLPLTSPLPDGQTFGANSHAIGIMAMALIGSLAVLLSSSRLNAIVALGIQGIAVALLFLVYGAPDLAFTQFMVEILSVAILTLVMTRLKLDVVDHRRFGAHLLHGAIALAVAVGIGLTLISLTQQPLDLALSDFFTARSAPDAHGHNIVNVILVDFRGLDTLGEITVVLMAGLAALALIGMRRAGKKVDRGSPEPAGERSA